MILGRLARLVTACTVAAASLLVCATAQADRLADIKARGTLVCGTLTTTEPLGFRDPQSQQVVGFDVDMCSAVARQLGVQMEHKAVSVESRIPDLMQGNVDLVIAALGYTRERAQQIDFTASHYQNPIKVIVPTDSPANNLADLADKRISANRSSTSEQVVRRHLPKATLVGVADVSAGFLAMVQGRADAQALSLPSAIRFVNDSDGRYRFVDGSLWWEPTAMGVKKGEPALLAAINQALVTLERQGEIDALWLKWYGPKTKFNIKREKKLTPISAFQ